MQLGRASIRGTILVYRVCCQWGYDTCKINRDYKPPSCPNCGKLTSPTKRSPDYNLRYLRYERQVFACPACGEQTVRIKGIDGNLSS